MSIPKTPVHTPVKLCKQQIKIRLFCDLLNGITQINWKTVHNCNTLLPKDKILDWSKLKAFADDNLKVVKMMIYVLVRVENIVR